MHPSPKGRAIWVSCFRRCITQRIFHETVEYLLKHNFDDLVIVEPSTNRFIEILAFLGLAKRAEYSGLKPSWMDLGVIKNIAKRNGYDTQIQTWWGFPPGLARFFDWNKCLTKAVTTAVDFLSWTTGLFQFGSMSAVLGWNRVLGVNLTGAFLCAKHAAPYLRASGGTIVNIASTRALQSEANTEAYSASKGGLVALTHALAMSLAPEVRVNCVSPGWIDVSAHRKAGAPPAPALTELDHRQHPAGRVGVPEDVAALVAWLASPRAEFVTGANFVIDGGMTRKMIYA